MWYSLTLTLLHTSNKSLNNASIGSSLISGSSSDDSIGSSFLLFRLGTKERSLLLDSTAVAWVAIFDTTREPDTKFAGLGWGLMGSGHIRVEPV
jgi:hypothetical protein